MSIPIIEVKHGIANRFKTHIEINENLKYYPELYKKIIKHESSHTDKDASWEDFKLDLLSQGEISPVDLFWFMKSNPRSLTQFFPIGYSKYTKKIYYDINMLIVYGVMGAIIMGGIYLGIKFF